MKKVLLLNQGNTNNIGDLAINSVLTKILEKENIDYDFLDYWVEDKIFGKLYINRGNNLFYKFILKIIFHFQILLDIYYICYLKRNINLNNYDSIVIGGGELLCGHKGFNTAIYNITNVSRKKNIQLYLIGVSGDLRMPQKRIKRYSKSLTKFKKIFVRDEYTKKILNDVYKVESTLYPDVVFSYNKVFGEKRFLNKENSILLVPTYFNKESFKNMNIHNEEQFVDYYMKIIFEEMNRYDKLYITNTAIEDEKITKKIIRRLQKENLNFEYIKYESLDDYFKLICKTKKIISGRMHAMIMGCICGNDFRVIPFKEKLINFEKEYRKVDMQYIEELSYNSVLRLCECLRGEDNE